MSDADAQGQAGQNIQTLPSNTTATDSSFSNWEIYPRSLANFNPFCCNSTQLCKRLDDQAASLFSNETEVHVLDTGAKDAFKVTAKSLHSGAEIERHFACDLPELRIINFARKNSLKPFRISKELLLKILQRHQVGSCFLDLFLAFRNVEELSEKGHSFWSPVKTSPQSSEVCYQLKYVEGNDHPQGVKWSDRQVGVYHRFGSAERAVMILLHASASTQAQQQLDEAFLKGQYSQARAGSPFLLHCLIIGAYLDNWRWFLDDQGRYCQEKEDESFTIGLNHHSLSFRELQSLRNVQSRLLVASTILEATQTVIEGLEAAAKELEKLSSEAEPSTVGITPIEILGLETLRLKSSGYLRSIKVLQNRADKLIKLIADGLNLQSQNATIDIANSTHKLTQQSVDDNAIVKVITIITLIYLPTQGVATFFGMNLTSLPQPSNRITFAKDWWLFLATAVPLTILTLGMLGAAWLFERKKKAGRESRTRAAKD